METLAEFAAMTRDLMVGIDDELIWSDFCWPSETTFEETFVILPPEIVTVTVTEPKRCTAVVPVYVPSVYVPELELVVVPDVVVVPLVVVPVVDVVVVPVVVTASPVLRVAPFAVPTAQPAPRTPTDAIAAATFALMLMRKDCRPSLYVPCGVPVREVRDSTRPDRPYERGLSPASYPTRD